MKKFAKKAKTAVPMLLFIVIGGICGFLIAHYMDTVWAEESIGKILFMAAGMLVMLYAGIFLQIILHEGGHLVFGLLTGYRFSSFRIGSLMWVKRGGKLHFSRYSLAGTGGQCLLAPPELKDGKYPYKLYNMGGSLVNLITGVFFACLAAAFPEESLLFVFFVLMAVTGISFAAMNGIPMRLGTVDNDGYNACSIGKNPAALRAFWVQMKMNQQVSEGIRMKNMPEEWFRMPAEEEMKNSMVSVLGVMACGRLMDEHRFEDAEREMERLLSMEAGIVGVHKNLLKADLMFCEMVKENRKERLDALFDQEQKKFMRMMKRFPSIIRTEYVYALLVEKDAEKAEEIRGRFEKDMRKYPYPTEVEAERELMEYADILYVRNKKLGGSSCITQNQ